MTARQAAYKLGWSGPYLSRRLKGHVPFDVADLEALATLLDMPMRKFFDPLFGVEAMAEAPEQGSTSQYFAPAQVRALRVAA